MLGLYLIHVALCNIVTISILKPAVKESLVQVGSLLEMGSRFHSLIAVLSQFRGEARFEKLCVRKPVQKAIVAIARQLLVRVWHLWHHSSTDRDADEAAVARKMKSWGIKMRKSGRQRANLADFVRGRLDNLELGTSLAEVPSLAKVKLALPASRRNLVPTPSQA